LSPSTKAYVTITILADGVIQTKQSAMPLAFEAGGKLLEVHVQVGDLVQVGDVIAMLDDTDLQEAIDNAKLQVEQAENSLAQVQLELDKLLNWEPDEFAVAQAQANLNQVLAGASQHEIMSAQDAVKSAQANLNRVLNGQNQDEITVAAANLRRVEVGAMPQSTQLEQATISYESALY